MSIEGDLIDLLGPLVGGRIWPLEFPLKTPRPIWPAIRYSIVSQVPAIALCGNSDEDAADMRVQIDVVDSTSEGARALKQAIVAAMVGFTPPAVMQSSSPDKDADTSTFSWSIDYEIYASST